MKNTITINTNGKFEVECVEMVDNGSNSILLNVITGENPESLKIYVNNTLVTTFSGLISASENLFLLPEDCYVADAMLKVQYGSAYTITFSFPSSNIGNMTVEKVSDLSYSVKYSASVQPMTDFVVEQGTADGWTYRKWNSGIAECWGNVQQTISTKGNSDGSYFYAYIDPVATYPIFFSDVPIVNISIVGRGLATATIGTRLRKSIGVYIQTAYAVTDELYYLQMHCKGRWK